METPDLQQRLGRKELELKALLEITQAINANVPEDSLFKIFKFTAISNLQLRRLVLLVRDQEWQIKAVHGHQAENGLLPLPNVISRLTNIASVKDLDLPGSFGSFDLVIPVLHQGENLAVVLVESTGTAETMGFLQALCNIMIVALENRKFQRQEVEQEIYRRELEIARDVQLMLFPEKLPQSGRIRLEASYLPHDRVGGDYYDYIPMNNDQFLVCIADVSGKGVGAAMLMSNFQASLRTLLRHTQDLPEIVRTLNEQVMESARGERFITFFAAIYHTADRCLTYINCGHNPPLLWTAGAGVAQLREGTTVLGAVRNLPGLNTTTIHSLDDFLLFCYTDGLTETWDEAGREFGIAPVEEYLSHGAFQNLSRMHQDIIIALDGFKGRNPYGDDITMLTCRVENRITD